MVEPRGSRFKKDIRIKPDKKPVRAEAATRLCEAPDCIRARRKGQWP